MATLTGTLVGSDSVYGLESVELTGTNYPQLDAEKNYALGVAAGTTAGTAAGRKLGERKGMAIGLARGKAQGFEQGFVEGQSDIHTGFAVAKSLSVVAGPVDTEAPTVTITAFPALGDDPIVVEVSDSDGLGFVQLTCQERSDGPKYVVYDDTGFQFPYQGTVTGIGDSDDPYIFTVTKIGRWPSGIDVYFTAKAFDNAGNQGSDS